MHKLQQLHQQIEEAFSLTAPGEAKPEQNADARARKRHLNRSIRWRSLLAGILLAVSAVLGVIGITTKLRWPVDLADGALLAGIVLASLSLIIAHQQTARKEADNDQLRIALETAERKSALKSQLLATVSHDLRTPLSGIAGMGQLLNQTRLTPEQANYLTGIRQSTSALSQLVDDLLDFVSIETGHFHLRLQKEYIRQLIEAVVEMLASRAHQKDIEVASWVSSTVPARLTLDAARLRQVLYNLIGNAVKFTSEGGVLVHVDMDGNDLVIAVRDTGPGMTKEEQDRVFLEFEQAGSEKSKAAGTGLGLAISQRIIVEAGGSIGVKSVNEEGSVFTVRLPVKTSGDVGEAEARRGTLKGSRVLALARPGVTSTALAETIHTLGGNCSLAANWQQAEDILEAATNASCPITDIIVDHRVAAKISSLMERRPELAGRHVRRIFLVSPEARAARPIGPNFDAWLIRPLRERSLIGVLQGRMTGIELRDPLDDKRSIPASRWTSSTAGGLNVLLGEDDPVNRLLLRTVLQKAGHKVREADTFHALISSATHPEDRPEIIVTDLSMPGGSGLDALAAIRNFERSNRLEELPIIVVTGSTGTDVRSQAITAGATHVLTKPAEPQKLTQLVSSFANRRAV